MQVIIFISVLFGILNFARSAEQPPKSSSTCVACHGAAGISINEMWPNLAGQKKGYIKEQLLQFQSGARINSLMSPIAQTLSKSDIDELAQYYSTLRGSIQGQP